MWAARLRAAGFDGRREGIRLASVLPSGNRARCLVRATVLLAVLPHLAQFHARLHHTLAFCLFINPLPAFDAHL